MLRRNNLLLPARGLLYDSEHGSSTFLRKFGKFYKIAGQYMPKDGNLQTRGRILNGNPSFFVR
jgi:hypothetical protein